MKTRFNAIFLVRGLDVYAQTFLEHIAILPNALTDAIKDSEQLCACKPDAEQWTVLMQRYVADWTRLTGLEVPHDTRPADCRSHHSTMHHDVNSACLSQAAERTENISQYWSIVLYQQEQRILTSNRSLWYYNNVVATDLRYFLIVQNAYRAIAIMIIFIHIW